MSKPTCPCWDKEYFKEHRRSFYVHAIPKSVHKDKFIDGDLWVSWTHFKFCPYCGQPAEEEPIEK